MESEAYEPNKKQINRNENQLKKYNHTMEEMLSEGIIRHELGN